MVSALASSSVTLPLNVSVKVLVSDWDLLCGTHKYRSSLVFYICSEGEKVKDARKSHYAECNLYSTDATCTRDNIVLSPIKCRNRGD